MYLSKFTVRQVKSFAEVTLDFQQPDGSIRLWNVIIGENGTGKTTLLQTIAMALAGEKAASVLLPRPRGWVRIGAQKGEIEACYFIEKQGTKRKVRAKLAIVEEGSEGPAILEESRRTRNGSGGFAAGYGPFRRLSGGSEQAGKLVKMNSKEARFVTLFREDAALIQCEQWLKDLDYARLDSSDPENQKRAAALLQAVRETINSYLLPEGVRLESINPRGVYFRTPVATRIALSDLSDGYRAMLALGIDLIRPPEGPSYLSHAYSDLVRQTPEWLRHVTGVVLIDELDAHLHPTWQREISFWLKACFPRLQFIVATHSPFIPQAADKGGLYILRRPPDSDVVQAFVDEPYVRGWRADQILAILFDTPSMYDSDTEQRLREYARLKIMAEMGQLPPEEAQSFAQLQAWVDANLAPPGETRAELERARNVRQRAQELSQLGSASGLFRKQASND